MGANDPHIVRYSTGTGRNLGRAKNQTKSLKHFTNLFLKALRTNERQKDYAKLSEEEQKTLKSIAGWLYRTHVEGAVRNRGSGQPSDMVSFDFDYASPAFLAALISGEIMGEYEWFLHTTRRHHPEKPRVRLFVFLASPIPNDHYVAVSRIIARMFDPDMEHVDKVSFRPAQMMFFPTASADQEYLYHRNEGSLIDPKAILDEFELIHGDWRDIQNLPKVPGEELRETAEKAEDPTTKQGPVGDFCRAYSVPEAIEQFLSDKYEAVEVHTGKPRYTYLGGTTTNGAEVQDDGLFLYSHHGSDPTADMLINAFDLVRIHLFGDQDKPEDRDKPITKRPSYLAMLAFIQDDPQYKAQVVQTRYGGVQALRAEFDDEDVVADGFPAVEDVDQQSYDPEIEELVGTPVSRNVHGAPVSRPTKRARTKRPKPEADWMTKLDIVATSGLILAKSTNIAQIIDCDPRTRDTIAFDEFTQKTVIRDPLRTKLPYVPVYPCKDPLSGTPVQDHHVMALRMMLEAPNGTDMVGYGLRGVTDRDINGAIDAVDRLNSFHPVQEYLKAVAPVPRCRAESLFVKYLGCPDSPYHRQAAVLFLVAAVARAFEPGHKFDFAPILFGGQGKRKSTFISILGKGWSGELKADFKDEKKLVEQTIGCWIVELPELASIQRSQIEDVKAYISGLKSSVRLSYDRRPAEFPRQCVFIGSTNDEVFLVDDTGNRRWWPIEVAVDMIDTDALARDIDGIWADAVRIYREMRLAQPYGDLPLYISSAEALAELEALHRTTKIATDVEIIAEQLGPLLDRPVTDGTFEERRATRRSRVLISEARELLKLPPKPAPGEGRVVQNALRKAGWRSVPNPTKNNEGKSERYYVPSPTLLARWRREDSTRGTDGTDMI